ncbi:hypothetical protein ACFLZ7_03895 [Nanoarchaeota archaeon]
MKKMPHKLKLGKLIGIDQLIKEEEGRGWFIVSKKGKVLTLHADFPGESRYTTHKEVAKRNKLPKSRVMGGGIASYVLGDIRLDSASKVHGTVPDLVMEEYGQMLKDKYPEIKNVEVNMRTPGDEDTKRWEPTGWD